MVLLAVAVKHTNYCSLQMLEIIIYVFSGQNQGELPGVHEKVKGKKSPNSINQ